MCRGLVPTVGLRMRVEGGRPVRKQRWLSQWRCAAGDAAGQGWGMGYDGMTKGRNKGTSVGGGGGKGQLAAGMAGLGPHRRSELAVASAELQRSPCPLAQEGRWWAVVTAGGVRVGGWVEKRRRGKKMRWREGMSLSHPF